jgi:hypothetical protein
MPVATLIVVRPRIEVKAIKGNSLDADWNGRKMRADVSIEAIFVHAEIQGRISQSYEPRQERK